MSEQSWPGNQEVEKSGGAPVREGPPTTPEQALDSDVSGASDDAAERRPDTDQSGQEPDEAEEP